jgi:hypothetical protein
MLCFQTNIMKLAERPQRGQISVETSRMKKTVPLGTEHPPCIGVNVASCVAYLTARYFLAVIFYRYFAPNGATF